MFERGIPMTGYFSFQKFITASLVKLIYLPGCIALTAGSIVLIVWSGLRLNAANIDRQLGWRYIVIGVAVLIVGNFVWRMICELWMVLFSIDKRLAELNLHSDKAPFVERRVAKSDRRVAHRLPEMRIDESDQTLESFKPTRSASVLGLS
jgi:hypothetical protein